MAASTSNEMPALTWANARSWPSGNSLRPACQGEGRQFEAGRPLQKRPWSQCLLAINESSDDFALIDDAADELFGYPLAVFPPTGTTI
jgi:hypothetical protein